MISVQKPKQSYFFFLGILYENSLTLKGPPCLFCSLSNASWDEFLAEDLQMGDIPLFDRIPLPRDPYLSGVFAVGYDLARQRIKVHSVSGRDEPSDHTCSSLVQAVVEKLTFVHFCVWFVKLHPVPVQAWWIYCICIFQMHGKKCDDQISKKWPKSSNKLVKSNKKKKTLV